MDDMSNTRKEIMERLGAVVEGEKAKMAASVRRGVDPKKGGQWITGTWDGGTWSAKVFSEPSEAYGIPEFPHISKLSINPKDKPGIAGMIVNYDRGWDIKPNTPELQKAYREIAQVATAEVNKAVKQGWYSRTGEKATMGAPSMQEVRSRLAFIEKQIDSAEQSLRSASKQGKFQECHGWCKVIAAEFAKLGATYLQWDAAAKALNASRPGAKAKMAIRSDSDVFDVLTEASDKGLDRHNLVREARRLRDAIDPHGVGGQAMLKHKSWPQLVRLAEQIERLPAAYARPGAKVKMDLTDVQRKAGYKWRVAYTKQLGKDEYLGGPPVTIQDDLLFATESAARQWADAMLKKGWFKSAGGGPEKVLKATVLMASRPGAKAIAAKTTMAAHPENIAWMRSLPASVVNQVRSILQKPHSSARAKALRDALKAGDVGFNQFVPDASAGAEVLGHQFREAFAKPSDLEREDVKAGLKLMAASDEAVSDKIRTLIAEGKPQDQAVAIALDMKRRGEI